MVSARTFDSAVRENELGEVILILSISPRPRGIKPGNDFAEPGRPQILPATSFCIRLAISTSRRHACSRNDITRSMSRSLGSGISILRSLSALWAPAFQRIRLRQRLVDLAGNGRLARRQLPALSFSLSACKPADFRIQCGAFVGHGIAGPACAGVAAGRNGAGPGIEPDHAVGNRRQRVAAVLAYPASARAFAARFRKDRASPPQQPPGRVSSKRDLAPVMGILRASKPMDFRPASYTCER